jgi:hypothetical protein
MRAHSRPVSQAIHPEAAAPVEARSFGDFYGSPHQRLFTALCLVTGNRHEAEEIMQDAFLRLYERLPDGSTIAFVSNGEMFLIHPDGTGLRRVACRGRAVIDSGPSFAPAPAG